MMRATSAAARALRNSDYVSPETKRELLQQIVMCWEQTTTVLLIILPVLTSQGYADYDGLNFYLGKGFSNNEQTRFLEILSSIPGNVMSLAKDDLYSRKMGPLLIDQLENRGIGDIGRHEMVLLLIDKRPRDWEKQVNRYIAKCEKNSFYLYDVYCRLRTQYRYGYASAQTLLEIEHLIKVVATKHVTGERLPGEKTINKTNLKPEIIPTREADQ
jgi:hypothetical protein